MFSTGSFQFSRPFDMNERCSHCGQHFTPEVGFYYGAMFISYILSGWFCLAVVALLHWVLKVGLLPSFLILLAILAFLFVWVFRISRSLWLHINVKYNPTAARDATS